MHYALCFEYNAAKQTANENALHKGASYIVEAETPNYDMFDLTDIWGLILISLYHSRL